MHAHSRFAGTYTLAANTFTAPANKQFKGWSYTADGEVINTPTITVSAATTLYAIWENIPEYTVTVTGGTGGGNYVEGATVTITANEPATGKQFKNWTTSDGVTFANADASSTTFTMPAKAVTVTANYEDIPAVTYTVITGIKKFSFYCPFNGTLPENGK